MRDVIYGAACSLDGFITGPNGEIDWLHFSKDVQQYMAEFWPTLDTLLMGRKTYEQVLKYEDAGSGGNSGMMSSIVASYVFSRTLTEVRGRNTHLVRENAADFVRNLKTQPGKRICLFGGGDFAGSMFAAGLVDEVGINIHPILLGAGTPLFVDPGRRVEFALKNVRPLSGGCVMLQYRAKRSARRPAEQASSGR